MNKIFFAVAAFCVALVAPTSSAQSIMQEPEFSKLYKDYGAIGVKSVLRWRGGYVVAGQFDYWFDGKLFSNLMRLDDDFRPDSSWTPPIVGAAHALVVNRDGALIVGGGFTLGEQSILVRFSANGALDKSWKPTVAGEIYSLAAGSDGELFVGGAFSAVNGVERRSLAKFTSDGILDSAWANEITDYNQYNLTPGSYGNGSSGVRGMFDAGTDGVFFNWERVGVNTFDSTTMRVDRSGTGRRLALPSSIAQGTRALRDPHSGTIYATASLWYLPPVATNRGSAIVRLLPNSLEVDPTWGTKGYDPSPFGSPVGLAGSHVYACRDRVNFSHGRTLTRVDVTTGSPDPTWAHTISCVAGQMLLTNGTDGARLLLWGDPFASLLAVSPQTLTNEPRTVVEYYSRVAKRFFITSRSNEQAALDAMPTTFVRTGMQFAALNALVQDTQDLRMPICRFYAPSSRGASNTHFYGSGSDCQTLKRYSFAVFEGYDFRAGVPVSGACARPTPMPVYRLFNDLVASNNANHRYVVSDARREEMVSAGWIDEGLAFCASDATDSGTLSGIVQ